MPDTQPDPHAGHGGSYILDPETGERRLVERTDYAGAVPADTQPAPAEGAEEH